MQRRKRGAAPDQKRAGDLADFILMTFMMMPAAATYLSAAFSIRSRALRACSRMTFVTDKRS